MNRKFTLVITIFGLIVLCIGYFGVLNVYGSGNICIAEDGSISPSTAPLIRKGDVYTFTGDVFFSKLIIEKDSVTVDGAGHSIEALNTGIGVLISGAKGITVFNLTIKHFEYGVSLGSCSNINISSNDIEHNRSYGVMVSASAGNTISDNNITANGSCGVYICSSSENNTICRNIITQNDVGIHLYWSGANNKVYQNTIVNSFFGVWSECSSNNPVVENNITSNNYGIKLSTACTSDITENIISNSTTYGMSIQGSSNDNTIYHNNLLNNTITVESYESTNAWDSDKEGNYWSSHCGSDNNHDGIVDAPFQIDEDNTDHFPLCGPFLTFKTPKNRVEVISNSTVNKLDFFSENGTIQIIVSNSSSDQSFGFCRISIPHELINPLDYSISVIIDGGETPALIFNDTLRDDGQSRWIFVAYEHSSHKITILPEFPLLTILFALAVSGAVAAILGRNIEHTRRGSPFYSHQ